MSIKKLQHEKFLKKMGVRKLTRSESKKTRSLANRGGLKSGYAESYYADTSNTIAVRSSNLPEGPTIDRSKERPEVLREMDRKNNLLRAINMPRPADLSDDAPERIIDQKHLQTPR